MSPLPAPIPAADDAAIRDLAREILARSEYAEADPGNLDRLVDRLLRALSDWLEWVGRLHETSPALYWLLFAGLLLVSLLLLAHVGWTVLAALRAGEPGTSRPVLRPPRDLAAEAEVLAADGRHLEAAHRLMLASLEVLARREWIELRPDEPNRIVRKRLREATIPGDVGATVERLLGRTERSWFRDRDDDPALYAEWREAYGRLAAGA